MTKSIAPTRVNTTIAACRNTYQKYPNVCGISVGNKYEDGEPNKGVQAVQVFVSEKILDETVLEKVVPKYVYERFKSGAVNRSKRIETDVIELKNLQTCCAAAGDPIETLGQRGTTTLIFADKDQVDIVLLLLTCSHVVGDLMASPANLETLVGGVEDCFVFAEIFANTVLKDERLEFDLALCLVTDIDSGFVDLAVRGETHVLSSFALAESMLKDSVYSCVFPISGETSLVLESFPTEFSGIDTGDRLISIGNLYACRGVATSGDSGGIVYAGDQAVGILVAKADDDWVLIHSLSDAVSWFQENTGIQFSVF